MDPWILILGIFATAFVAGVVRHEKATKVALGAAFILALPVLLHANIIGLKADETCSDLACQGQGWIPILITLWIVTNLGLAGYLLGRCFRKQPPVVGRRR